MYAEYNDSEDPTKDWEFSVEFRPEEWKEYQFYIAVERDKQVRPEVPRKIQGSRGRKARSRASVHVGMLQHASHKASVRQGR